jgi:hypothetical protein
MPVILALRRLRLEDQELEASLVYRVRPCLKKLKNINTIKNKWRGGRNDPSIVCTYE